MRQLTGLLPACLTLMTALMLFGQFPALAGSSVFAGSYPSNAQEYSLDMGVLLNANGKCSGNIGIYHKMSVTVGAVHDMVSPSNHVTSIIMDAAGNIHIQATGWEAQWTAKDGRNRAPNGIITIDISRQGNNYDIRVVFRPDNPADPATSWDFAYPSSKITIRGN